MQFTVVRLASYIFINKDIIVICWFNNITTSPDHHRVCLHAVFLLHNEAFKQTMYSKPEIAVHVHRPSQTG